MQNAKGQVFEHLSQIKERNMPTATFSKQGPDHYPRYRCTVHYYGYVASGAERSTKSEAEQSAYAQLYAHLTRSDSTVKLSAMRSEMKELACALYKLRITGAFKRDLQHDDVSLSLMQELSLELERCMTDTVGMQTTRDISVDCDDVLNDLAEARIAGWIRDLCKEGVEPNPGPRVLDVIASGSSFRGDRTPFKIHVECDELDAPEVLKVIKSWVRDLTIEGVESNPGPCSVANRKRSYSDFSNGSFHRECEDCDIVHLLAEGMDMHPSEICDCCECEAAKSWVRDLTMEGVEPNPGPVVEKITEVKKVAPKRNNFRKRNNKPKARPQRVNSGPRTKLGVDEKKFERAVNKTKVMDRSLSRKARELGSNAFDRIASALACPSTVPPIRWSTEFTSTPTAVAAPFVKYKVDWETDAAERLPSEYFTHKTMPIFVFRDPLRSYIRYYPNHASDQWKYYIYAPSQALSSSLSDNIPASAFTLPNVQEYAYINAAYAVSDTAAAIKPHGTTVYPGAVDEHGDSGRFFWIDANDALDGNFNIDISGPLTAGTLYVALDLWTTNGIMPEKYKMSITGLNTNASVAITQSGYYAVKYRYSDSTATAVAVVSNGMFYYGTCSAFGHHSMPGITENAPVAEAMRINALSVMYSNTAPMLQRGGTITGVQLNKDKHWCEVAQELMGDESALQQYQKCKTLVADNGIYGFLKPDGIQDFDLIESYEVFGNHISSAFYPLVTPGGYLAVVVEIEEPSGRDGYVTLNYGIEYLTTDVWRATFEASDSPELYTKALVYLKNLPQWHENPKHISEIWASIKRAGKIVADNVIKYAPTAMRFAEMALPYLAAI